MRNAAPLFRRACSPASSLLAIFSALSLTLTGRVASAKEQADPRYNAGGYDDNRAYSELAPFERVDTLTGHLILTFTDIVMPGHAGHDIRIQRIYDGTPFDTFSRRWEFSIAGMPMQVLVPTLPPPPGPLPETHWPRLRTGDVADHTAGAHLLGRATGSILSCVNAPCGWSSSTRTNILPVGHDSIHREPIGSAPQHPRRCEVDAISSCKPQSFRLLLLPRSGLR